MDGKCNEVKNKNQDVKWTTSVRFSRDCNEISITPDECDDHEDDIQISLAPYIQVYLAQSSQRVKCCGLSFPIPFERAARRSWWDPRFDSEILEGQYKLSAFPQIRLRFRYSLLYVFVVSLCWCVYLTIKAVYEEGKTESFTVALLFGSFSLFTLFILLFTRSNLYTVFHLSVSIMTAIVMFALSLISVGTTSVLSPVGDFSLCIEILMIIYTVIPLPLYMCVILGVSYSVSFEYFISSMFPMPLRMLCHICVHLIGIHILIMTNVRMRGTFMKVGQSLLVRRQLEMEKQLKEKMIHSVMPPKVADWLMSEGATGGREDVVHHNVDEGDIRSIFRPFNMHRMENVSILFADIVGFTRMSSTKTAEQLVGILNRLFERFDDLCTVNGCEKISTLGDCYYCVSGCPEPRADHAECCVEMGLGMIVAISQFEKESQEGVNMRVGVHTGTVLCGIVGTQRVKFDVWSNDVTLANKMESTGKPGMVHLSAKTREFLDDKYILEEGEPYKGMNTYFVRGRKYNKELSKSSLFIPSPQTALPSPNQPRRASISLATAISIHINQTAALEEVLNSSQSLSLRTPTTPGDTFDPFNFSPPLQNSSDKNSLSPMSEVPPTLPMARSRSPIQRVLQMSSPWKTSSLPSILDTEGNEHPDVIPSQNEYFLENRSSVLLPKKTLSPKWLYKKVPTSCSPEPQDLGRDILSDSTNPIESTHPIIVREDQTSICQSINSRKDSGIRSNSRKSSIQHPLLPTNGANPSDLLAHRVSGYYTSSQSSVNNDEPLKGGKLMTTSAGDHYGVCFQKLRKQSDLQLIRCVQDNSLSQRSYFVKPPLHSISLFFRQKDMEREYRRKAHRSCDEEASTLATARFNTHLDIAVALLVFILTSASCLILFGMPPSELLLFCLVLCGLQSIALFLCLRSVFWPELNAGLDRFSDWFSWHVIGGVLVSLPMIMILICVNASVKSVGGIYHFASLFFIGIIHFCNFTQLNCWMKSSIATVAGLIYLILITNYFHSSNSNDLVSINCTSHQVKESVPLPNSINEPLFKPAHSKRNLSVSVSSNMRQGTRTPVTDVGSSVIGLMSDSSVSCTHLTATNKSGVISLLNTSDSFTFQYEIYVDVLLILLLVWFLNREFEISYRLSFHGNIVAARDKAKVQMMKDQAEVLLHNIIPKHVAEHLKTTARYSENVHNAGIIFASIINFSEMYDESYLGGRECLRVLNELVSDFDELLSKPEFTSVEKIKTIGSTYMAASGLNSSLSDSADNFDHLYQLMEFALRLQAVVDAFNKDLLEFNLILRIGYSYGDITAGVIGTTKLYYDIWGDAVNIASRMDSTGVPGRIQLPAYCVPALEEKYEFEKRGQVYVKGKDNMVVYLLVDKKQPLSTKET